MMTPPERNGDQNSPFRQIFKRNPNTGKNKQMKKMKLATSAFALGALALSAGADQTNDVWSVNFNDMTAAWDVSGQEDETVWTITSQGSFERQAGDTSTVVSTYKETQLESDALELKTEGNELVFTPATSPSGDKTVIDADIYFIASDTNPTITEVAGKPVQAALFLYANENDTTELRAYNYTDGGNVWTGLNYDLSQADVSTGIWLHVTITSQDANITYTVSAKDGSGATSDTFLRANNYLNPSFHEVVFKGTGLVDNFTGKSVTVETVSYTYAASVESGTTDAVELDNVTGNTAQFLIPLLDDNDAPLSRIEVLGTNGVARTITVAVDTTSVDPVATFTENGTDTTGIADLDPFDVDISEFLESGEPDGTEFTVLKLYYTAAGGEETWGDDQAADQAQLDTELAAGFAAVAAGGDEPVAFDATDGFTVKFRATVPGTYSLVYATSPDAANASYEVVENQEVSVSAAEAEGTGKLVEFSDEDTTGAGAPAARFYKIKVSGPKE